MIKDANPGTFYCNTGIKGNCPSILAFPYRGALKLLKRGGGVLRERQTVWLAFGIQEAIHRPHYNATGLVIVACAFVAFAGIDNVNIITFGYCPGRAFSHAKTAIDAIVGNR